MATSAPTKEHAHELIERMPETHLASAVEMLEKMVDPVAYALANAPWEDEPISAEENEAAARALTDGYASAVPLEEVLKDFGLTVEEFERMGEEPLDPRHA